MIEKNLDLSTLTEEELEQYEKELVEGIVDLKFEIDDLLDKIDMIIEEYDLAEA